MEKMSTKSLIIVFGIIFFTVISANAGEINFRIKGIYSIYQDKDLREDGKGIKTEGQWEWFYLWGSWEKTEMRLTGQVAGDINLYGIGIGSKIKILKPLSIFLEVGYYIPDSDLEKNTQRFGEGVGYYWIRTLKEIDLNNEFFRGFNHYKYELKSNFGGSVGLEFEQIIYKGLSLNLFGAYRFLNLKEDWDAFNPAGLCIQTKEKRSFSGGQFGIGLNYKF